MEEKLETGFNLQRALELAVEYHKNQRDESGRPYIEHILAVVGQLQGEEARMTAALHDIVEDTPMTFDLLRASGCPEKVVDSVRLVTHSKKHPTEEEYFADIKNIADSGDQNAIDTKWADLTHNSDKSRLSNPTEYDVERWQKYAKSKEMLKPLVSKYLLER